MTELEREYKEARKQWLVDAQSREEDIFRDHYKQQYIKFDGVLVWLPMELTSKQMYVKYLRQPISENEEN
jgi:hypothetical protein